MIKPGPRGHLHRARRARPQLRLVLGQGPRRATEAPGGAQLGEAVMSGCSQTNDEHTNAGDIDGPPRERTRREP